jgi:hypothetical protein
MRRDLVASNNIKHNKSVMTVTTPHKHHCGVCCIKEHFSTLLQLPVRTTSSLTTLNLTMPLIQTHPASSNLAEFHGSCTQTSLVPHCWMQRCSTCYMLYSKYCTNTNLDCRSDPLLYHHAILTQDSVMIYGSDHHCWHMSPPQHLSNGGG